MPSTILHTGALFNGPATGLTPASGVLIVDVDNNSIKVGDGTTLGGVSMSIAASTPFADITGKPSSLAGYGITQARVDLTGENTIPSINFYGLNTGISPAGLYLEQELTGDYSIGDNTGAVVFGGKKIGNTRMQTSKISSEVTAIDVYKNPSEARLEFWVLENENPTLAGYFDSDKTLKNQSGEPYLTTVSALTLDNAVSNNGTVTSGPITLDGSGYVNHVLKIVEGAGNGVDFYSTQELTGTAESNSGSLNFYTDDPESVDSYFFARIQGLGSSNSSLRDSGIIRHRVNVPAVGQDTVITTVDKNGLTINRGNLVIDSGNLTVSGTISASNVGVIKAFAHVDVSGIAIETGSLNVASVTSSATGKYDVTFTTPLPNANYVPALSVQTNVSSNHYTVLYYNRTTTGFQVQKFLNGVLDSGASGNFSFVIHQA